MRTLISIQLLLMAIICCWLTPICGPRKVVTFYGRITPFEQELIEKKEEITIVKNSLPVIGQMLSKTKSKIEYNEKKQKIPIIWTVEIVECVGCDQKYGPELPSAITQNGAFYISLMPKSDDGSGIQKLVVKIKSTEEIPMRKSEDEKGDDMHREFTWTLNNPNFDIIHHFQFGHFRRSMQNEEGIYLKMQFAKALPMLKSDISTPEKPKKFIKYFIRVERENYPTDKCLKFEKWEKIFERDLKEKDGEIQAGQPFKMALVQYWEVGSKLESRLLKPRPMKIIVEKVPICGICNEEKKGGSTTIRKLSNCNDYVHRSCINEHKAVESKSGGNEYKCPICNQKMEVKKGKDGNKGEKNTAVFDQNAESITLNRTFMEFKLKMPILQNGDEPKFIYKFDYENKNDEKENNYYNNVGTDERKENSQMIGELISALKSDWLQSTVSESTHRRRNVPPPPPSQNVDSSGASSSHQPKSDISDSKKKGKMHENPENSAPSQQHSTKEIKPKSDITDSKKKGKMHENPPPPAVPKRKSLIIEEIPPHSEPIYVIEPKMQEKIDSSKPPSQQHSKKEISKSDISDSKKQGKIVENRPPPISEKPSKRHEHKHKGIIIEDPQKQQPLHTEKQQYSIKEIKDPSDKDKASSSVTIEEIIQPREMPVEDPEFKNWLKEIIQIVVDSNIGEEEKMTKIEEEYENWEKKQGKPISLNELCHQIVQIGELDLKTWKEAVRDKVGNHIVEMQPKIVEMIELRWIRKQQMNLEPEIVEEMLKIVDSILNKYYKDGDWRKEAIKMLRLRIQAKKNVNKKSSKAVNKEEETGATKIQSDEDEYFTADEGEDDEDEAKIRKEEGIPDLEEDSAGNANEQNKQHKKGVGKSLTTLQTDSDHHTDQNYGHHFEHENQNYPLPNPAEFGIGNLWNFFEDHHEQNQNKEPENRDQNLVDDHRNEQPFWFENTNWPYDQRFSTNA